MTNKSISMWKVEEARDIFTQYMGYGNETISSRSWEATQGNRCPYIKTEWPKRKKRDKDKSLKLF